MLLLEIIIATLMATGLFFILADIYRIPYFKTSRALIASGKKQKKKNIIKEEAVYFAERFIKINQYKRERLIVDLKAADINITPEHHIANAFVKSHTCFSYSNSVHMAVPISVTYYILFNCNNIFQ